ncbi:MAG: nucleotidyl transferase AbiEii/AbiGii toxin family protein [Deltaproteobacteria bacterium]|nr:nucleotidyl transferase AbiEii/AbiGii toxin family protein [Deltaproteobacteria bacterium]
MIRILRELSSSDYLNEFFLVGGTALALHLGHRVSIDIDLFSTNEFDAEKILQKLEQDFQFEMSQRETNTLLGSIKGVKVDLVTHAYPMIKPLQIFEGIRIADILDISAMKVNAISVSGERIKDFVDLYYLLKEFTIAEIVGCYELKYRQRNSMHAIKSLIYFEDVDVSEWPRMIKEPGLKWDTISKSIENDCIAYIKNLPDQP